ncbi:MAG: hypothetical protein E7508_08090 [Ruminococcus sp.]|nr:hypothetical protein [Ruminococcus sp.]
MIERLAEKITRFIYRNTTNDSEMFEVYKYGVEITISSFLNISLILLCSLVISDILAGIAFLISFIILRSFTGGYHAKTYFMCNGLFVLTFLIVYAINCLLNMLSLPFRVLEMLVLLNCMPIILFAPIENKQKRLDEQKKKNLRIKAVITFIIISVAALALCFFNNKYGTLVIITTSAVSVMIVIEILRKRRNKI